MKKLILELEVRITDKMAQKMIQEGIRQLNEPVLLLKRTGLKSKKVYLKRARIK